MWPELPEFQWNYMDLYQNNQSPGLEMQNIPLIYEKVSATWYISSAQSEQQSILFPATTSILIEVQH